MSVRTTAVLLSEPNPLHWLAAVLDGVRGFLGGRMWYLPQGDII